MLNFETPQAFFLLLLVPLFLFLRKVGILKRIEFPLTLGDWKGIPFRWSSPLMKIAETISRILLGTGFICTVCALAGPVRFRQEPVYSGAGTSIVFVLDVSPSMAARDMGNETRITTAKQYIHSFIAKRPGDAFGLVALGSDAALLVPPTTDHLIFTERLDSLAIGEMGDGTALGLGLAVAAAHLANRDYRSNAHSCIVLLTDGENNTGEINPKTAASIFPAHNIALYIVGIGTRGEVPLDYTDPITGRHYSGTLSSDYNEDVLRGIALRGNGTYISAGNSLALENVFRDIGEAIPATDSVWRRTVTEPLEHFVLVAALIFFALAWILRRLYMGAIL